MTTHRDILKVLAVLAICISWGLLAAVVCYWTVDVLPRADAPLASVQAALLSMATVVLSCVSTLVLQHGKQFPREDITKGPCLLEEVAFSARGPLSIIIPLIFAPAAMIFWKDRNNLDGYEIPMLALVYILAIRHWWWVAGRLGHGRPVLYVKQLDLHFTELHCSFGVNGRPLKIHSMTAELAGVEIHEEPRQGDSDIQYRDIHRDAIDLEFSSPLLLTSDRAQSFRFVLPKTATWKLSPRPGSPSRFKEQKWVIRIRVKRFGPDYRAEFQIPIRPALLQDHEDPSTHLCDYCLRHKDAKTTIESDGGTLRQSDRGIEVVLPRFRYVHTTIAFVTLSLLGVSWGTAYCVDGGDWLFSAILITGFVGVLWLTVQALLTQTQLFFLSDGVVSISQGLFFRSRIDLSYAQVAICRITGGRITGSGLQAVDYSGECQLICSNEKISTIQTLLSLFFSRGIAIEYTEFS